MFWVFWFFGFFFFWLAGMWDYSSLTRDWTHTSWLEGQVLITGLPGKSLRWCLACKNFIREERVQNGSKQRKLHDRSNKSQTHGEVWCLKGPSESSQSFYSFLLPPHQSCFPGGTCGKRSCLSVQETWEAGSNPRSRRFLEEDMATPSNILIWRTSWTEEPGRL